MLEKNRPVKPKSKVVVVEGGPPKKKPKQFYNAQRTTLVAGRQELR